MRIVDKIEYGKNNLLRHLKDPKKPNSKLKLLVRDHLYRLDWSQNDLALQAQLDPGWLSHALNGKRPATESFRKKLIAAFNLTPSEISEMDSAFLDHRKLHGK